MKSFGKSPTRRTPRAPKATRGGGFNPNKEPEAPLTGQVQSQRAAQGEERFARTLEKGIRKGLVLRHYFRWTTLKRSTLAYKELDELVILPGRTLAISIKGEDFVHRSAASKNQDRINELIILNALKKLGINVPEITSIAAADLATQEQADKVGRRLGVYR